MISAADTIRRWRNDPVSFVRENFGVEPDLWQVDALRSLKTQGVNRLCMKACAGPGKSAVLAWIGWWFLSCTGNIGQHPKGIAVAITADNLKRNLWAELAKWQARSAYLSAAFTHQAERIFANDHPKTWFLDAGSFAKSANEQQQGQTLSGLHSEYPFALLDESGAMAPAIGRAAEQAMGGAVCGLIAQAGNPTSLDGLLYESSMINRKNWTVIEITADPGDPKRTPRVDPAWAEEQIQKWGIGNPWVMAYILGKFPPGSINSLIDAETVTAALGRQITYDKYAFASKIVSADVARFGDDRTVIWRRQGLASWMPDIMRNARTEDIAARVTLRAKAPPDGFNPEWNADAIMVDGTGGWGAGTIDALRLAGWKPIEVQYSGTPNDPQFFNKRSEIHWKACQWIKDGGCLPNLPELVKEFTAATYWLERGKLRVEEKEQIKRRLGYSPDLVDGLATGFAVDVAPKSLNIASRHEIERFSPTIEHYNPIRRR
jgi:hypothetical protein